MKETQWIAIKMAQMALGDGSETLCWVMSVRLVGLSNVALSGYSTLDSTTPRINDVVLLTAQTDPSQNGVWIINPNGWTRQDSSQQSLGMYFYVEEGVTKSNSLWRVSEALPNLTISQWTVSASGVPTSRQIIAGAGLTGGGDLSADRTLNVAANVDGSIVVGANDVGVGVLATDAQHGVRGGNNLHAVAGAQAGFMSSSDKSKLDGLPSTADPAGTASTSMSNHVADADPHPQYLTQTEGDARYLQTIADGSITNAKLANMGANTIKGTDAPGGGAPEDLTVAEVNAMLPIATSELKGLAPASGGGTSNFLRADLTWAPPPSGPGGGASGTGIIDFGVFPGMDTASVAVADSGILGSSVVKVWLRYADASGATGTHTADEHLIDGPELIAGNINAGVGFTVYGVMKRDYPVVDVEVSRGRYSPNNNTSMCYGPWSFAWQRL